MRARVNGSTKSTNFSTDRKFVHAVHCERSLRIRIEIPFTNYKYAPLRLSTVSSFESALKENLIPVLSSLSKNDNAEIFYN